MRKAKAEKGTLRRASVAVKRVPNLPSAQIALRNQRLLRGVAPTRAGKSKGIKVCHYTAYNLSGMNRVAESLVQAERVLGLDSHLVNIQETFTGEWDQYADADIHVAHTHFPEQMRKKLTKPLKLVWVSHGTPDHVFNSAVAESDKGYGHGDGLMLMMHWMKVADARVTFWPRHQAILQSIADNGTKVHCIELGVDLDFWANGVSGGKYAGNPSVWSGENCHPIKWPFDLLIAWPWVYSQLDGASLHLNYLPTNLHRYFFPLVNANGASYGAHISPLTFAHSELRNIFKSVDHFCGLVSKGDYNRLSLEANAAGCSTISYKGNPYSSYWIDEGDQRIIAQQLVAILKGEVEPRKDKKEVVDISVTARGMKAIYEGIL